MSQSIPEVLANTELILASKSPRRSQLLGEAGFQFKVKTKNVKEDYPSHLTPHQVPLFLAEKKATACQTFLKKNKIILAADTIVAKGKNIYEKPTDKKDAERILTKLSGKWHEVITGVCLLSKKKKVSFIGVSKVKLEKLTATEIDYYIEKFQPYDKAGAYAIQEWIGLCKISKIKGTYSNIMGLPVDLVYRHLQAF
ncbi:MAG: Maf family nucleotide pyrophosphatase [Saprospiraceae bacterium]